MFPTPAFLDPLTILGEFSVLMSFGNFVAQEADTAVTQIGDDRFLRAEHEAQGCQKLPDFLPDVFRQPFAADDHDDEVIRVSAVFDLEVIRVKGVLHVHRPHPLEQAVGGCIVAVLPRLEACQIECLVFGTLAPNTGGGIALA